MYNRKTSPLWQIAKKLSTTGLSTQNMEFFLCNKCKKQQQTTIHQNSATSISQKHY